MAPVEFFHTRYVKPIHPYIFDVKGLFQKALEPSIRLARSNVTDPTALMVENHWNEMWHTVFNYTASKTWLYTDVLSILEAVPIHINQTTRVHPPQIAGVRCAPNNAAVRMLVTNRSVHLILNGRV